MKKINLAVTGCLGRMGQQIIKSSKKEKNFKLVAITENRMIKKKILGLKPQMNSESALTPDDVIAAILFNVYYLKKYMLYVSG